MPAITGNEIITDAYAETNQFLLGGTIPDRNAQFARRKLNDMINSWGQRNIFIPVISRERFDLVAGQGGTTNPYTIGPGGDFDTERPSNQNSIVSANLILTASSPEVRVPLGIYTDQAYDANQLPDMSNSQPTGLYYNPTYDNDLGSIYLWPVPNISTNDLELFLQKGLNPFADLTTTYYVPDSAPEALKYNLALRLASPGGRQLTPESKQLAVNSLGVFKRSNVKLSDLMNDAYMFSEGLSTLYNINTGNG